MRDEVMWKWVTFDIESSVLVHDIACDNKLFPFRHLDVDFGNFILDGPNRPNECVLLGVIWIWEAVDGHIEGAE